MTTQQDTLSDWEKEFVNQVMVDFVKQFHYPILSPEYYGMFEGFIKDKFKLLSLHQATRDEELVKEIENLNSYTIGFKDSDNTGTKVVMKNDVLVLVRQK